MKLGIIIYSDDTETVWNAFRLGNYALKEGDDVKVFLLAKGVEYEKLDTKQFNLTMEAQAFADAGGLIFACGSCLKIRNSNGSQMCPVSTMKDLYDIIKQSDKTVTF